MSCTISCKHCSAMPKLVGSNEETRYYCELYDAIDVEVCHQKGPSMVTDAELEKRFTYHPPKGSQIERYHLIREAGYRMSALIAGMTPEGCEQSIALTKLDEAVMWANAAIARNEP